MLTTPADLATIWIWLRWSSTAERCWYTWSPCDSSCRTLATRP